LITTDGGLVSIETDSNDVIVNIISVLSFHDQVKQMRVKINSHVDALEQNILKDLDYAEDKIKSKLDNLLKQLSEQSVEGIQRDIGAVKEYVSDLQTFLGSKTIEEKVKKEERYII
jgi:F0F1-type ATP synthase membrane subunit b/b'